MQAHQQSFFSVGADERRVTRREQGDDIIIKKQTNITVLLNSTAIVTYMPPHTDVNAIVVSVSAHSGRDYALQEAPLHPTVMQLQEAPTTPLKSIELYGWPTQTIVVFERSPICS
jgi:hypothetical protein